MNDKPLKVLLVDDEEDNLAAFDLVLDDIWQVKTTNDPKLIFEEDFQLWTYDAIFLDMVMPNEEFPAEQLPYGNITIPKPDPEVGLQVLGKIQGLWPHIKVFILSALPYTVLRAQLLHSYPDVDYFQKPTVYLEDGFIENIEKLTREHQKKWKKELDKARAKS